ncbi:HNH endonuclease [Nodosilinea sp. FACHB-13]|uniref:HNH endonuclease n=1 Tax=Cyanophyceae TaxID=3028117 RepID=UPI00168924BA|nr:HNH endonuclease [Nodosilinea sp. FACHB-13]MBD2107013.1 HNH endonuclease [Nodosilinea sp. FACHB-13]
MTRTKRISIPRSVREYVLNRDNHQCKSCGKKSSEVKLQIDHILPLAKGGVNDISNLQTLCKGCNQKKSAKIDNRFRRDYTL